MAETTAPGQIVWIFFFTCWNFLSTPPTSGPSSCIDLHVQCWAVERRGILLETWLLPLHSFCASFQWIMHSLNINKIPFWSWWSHLKRRSLLFKPLYSWLFLLTTTSPTQPRWTLTWNVSETHPMATLCVNSAVLQILLFKLPSGMSS